MEGDDMFTILRIISMAQHITRPPGQQITRPPHNVSLPSTSATTSTAATSEISNVGSSDFDHESHERLRSQLKMLEKDLADVTKGVSSISVVTGDVSCLLTSLKNQANILQSIFWDVLLAPGGDTVFPADQVNASVLGVADVVLKLKSQIPSTGILRVQSVSDLINHLVNMPAYQEYPGCSHLKEFKDNYESLDERLQQCLFCFSAFPESYVADKTLLMYWWIGEGLIDTQENPGKIVEEITNEIVKGFMKFHFIEPVTKNGKLIGLRMPPFIRYVVAYLAERANFFDFDFEWNPTSDFRLCQRACLKETADGSSQQQLIEGARLHLEKLTTLFNFNERMVDITGKWFQKIRNVNVLYMGVWDDHFDGKFELRGSRSLKWLKRMKHLRFLGLQGFETSWEILEAIEEVENLRILTLKNWRGYFLKLKNSNSLRSLSHLELGRGESPPEVTRQFTELQVLKGFEISGYQYYDGTFLNDLARLTKLRKLSITSTFFSHFGDLDMRALESIKSLRKLTIKWSPPEDQYGGTYFPILPGLQKLALWFYPCYNNPYASGGVLKAAFPNLQKLHIRGGKVRDLPDLSVKILRLIDLRYLYLDWDRLRHKFPGLIYLETDKCPHLQSFPCDANGVWINNEELTEKLLEELGFSWSFLATYPSHEQRV